MSYREPENRSGRQPSDAPGLKLGKVGMILAFIPCTAAVGLILSVFALVQSNNVNVENKLAKLGVLAGVVWLIVGFVVNGTLG